jgi:hypothetical protein
MIQRATVSTSGELAARRWTRESCEVTRSQGSRRIATWGGTAAV